MPSGSDTFTSVYTYSHINPDLGNSSNIVVRTRTGDWSKTGAENPRHRSQIAAVEQAGTNFVGTRQHMIEQRGYVFAEWQHRSSVLSQYHWHTATGLGCPENYSSPTYVALPSFSTTVQSRAAARFISNCRDANRAIMAGVSLGEMGETLRMIRRPLQSLRKGVNDYLRDLKKIPKAVRTRKQAQQAVSGTWLEHSFGWRPLMSDIADGYDALERYRGANRLRTKRVRGFAQDQIPIASYMSTPIDVTGQLYYNHTSNEYQTRQSIHYGVMGISHDSRIAMARSLLGFNLEDFAPTLYELVPWSFLIDYFTNFGAVIDSWAFNTSRLRWYCRTNRIIGERVSTWDLNIERTVGLHTVPNLSKCNPGLCGGGPSIRISRQSSISRRADLPYPKVDFHFKIPGLSTQWINIAALIAARRESRGMFSRLG